MKTYDVMPLSGVPDWDNIPCAAMDNRLWSDRADLSAAAQVCWDENALYVRLQAREENILSRFTGELDDVYKDSCLEFFFCPGPDDRQYFNFELNPNGALYAGFGLPNPHRCRLYRPDFRELLHIQPFRVSGGWGVTLQIPVSFVRQFLPDFSLSAGKTLRANFFKCGDETVLPHYMAWSRVDVPAPNFHLPEYFGMLRLMPANADSSSNL